MTSFSTLQPHRTPASSSQPPLALPTLDPQFTRTALASTSSLALYPTGSIPPLYSYLHHSASEPTNPPHPQPNDAIGPTAPVPDVPNAPTSAPNDRSSALCAPRPRKNTSSVSKAIKAKKTAIGDTKSPSSSVQGIKLKTLPHPLRWSAIPNLGPIIPGPDPQFLSQERFSKDALPKPDWLDFILGAMMTRKCKNPWEVTVTIAELQPWKVWITGSRVTWPERLSSSYRQVSYLISHVRLPKDTEGYFTITDPTIYSLPKRPDKNKPKSRRRTVQDNEGGTAAAPSPNSIPFLSPVTTGTSHSTVTTGPPTPAFQNGSSDLVDGIQFDLFGQNDVHDGQTSSFQATGRTRPNQPVYSPTPAVSISTVVQPHTPAINLGPSGHSQLVNTPTIAFGQGYSMESLGRPALQVPTRSYQPSYQQVNGMDASLGAGSMTPFSASSLFLDFPLGGQLMNYASGEAYDELARYQWQNSINDRFTYL